MIRTSTWTVSLLPKRWNSLSWSTCRSLACKRNSMSPISSSRIVPPRATSNLPGRSLNAPVKARSEEHTSELQSPCNLVYRLLLEKKKREPYRVHVAPHTKGPVERKIDDGV